MLLTKPHLKPAEGSSRLWGNPEKDLGLFQNIAKHIFRVRHPENSEAWEIPSTTKTKSRK